MEDGARGFTVSMFLSSPLYFSFLSNMVSSFLYVSCFLVQGVGGGGGTGWNV